MIVLPILLGESSIARPHYRNFAAIYIACRERGLCHQARQSGRNTDQRARQPRTTRRLRHDSVPVRHAYCVNRGRSLKNTGITLKESFKRHADRYSEPQRVRLHRALSWLQRAENANTEDNDERFIFLWIAFNAAYANDLGIGEREREKLNQFLGDLLAVDADRWMQNILFNQFTGPIRTLLENKFVFGPFWNALREHDSGPLWDERFTQSRKKALTAIMTGETQIVLSIVFDRLYVLRNQLVHGGATWNSSVNRTQLKDGVAIMSAIVRMILSLMLEHPELDFGEIMYPVV